MTAWRSVPDGQREGRHDPAYVAAVQEVAERALQNGEGCWFDIYGRCKYPGTPFDWTPGQKGPLSFTAHHIERVMDGGAAVPAPDKYVPAHRGCNSADGLRAQNRRRAAHKRGEEYVPENVAEEAAINAALSKGLPPPLIQFLEPTSRSW